MHPTSRYVPSKKGGKGRDVPIDQFEIRQNVAKQMDIEKRLMMGPKEQGKKPESKPSGGGGGGGGKGYASQGGFGKALEHFGNAQVMADAIPMPKKSPLNAAKLRAIAQYAIQHDPIISERNPHLVTQAYKTLITVAPTLAHDPNAAISFLRHATAADTVGFQSLKDLADTERSITETKMKREGGGK